MRLFDCTLRDGANVVGNGFSKELTISMVEALLDCGIDQIELGNAKGMGANENGAEAPLSDLEYMQTGLLYKDGMDDGIIALCFRILQFHRRT